MREKFLVVYHRNVSDFGNVRSQKFYLGHFDHWQNDILEAKGFDTYAEAVTKGGEVLGEYPDKVVFQIEKIFTN